MTPMAHDIARQLSMPKNQRGPFVSAYSAQFASLLADTHFFECTGVLPLLFEMTKSLGEDREGRFITVLQKLAFLPAPKTWLEWKSPDGEGRIAVLMVQDDLRIANFARLYLGFETPEGGDFIFSYIGRYTLHSNHFNKVLPGVGSDSHAVFPASMDDRGLESEGGIIAMGAGAAGLLTFINSPRVIGRKQHMPHAGLERSLRQTFGAGKFPLHGWTEILLRVSKPVEIDDGEPHEALLTGRRALHFCRKHIRVRLGRLEYVSAHWRGDAALGIKQSRYTVAA